MRDIEEPQYSARKKYHFENDIAILFYKGQKVGRDNAENFRWNWVEEVHNFKNMHDFLDYVAEDVPELDDYDNNDNWENIWDNLEWNKKTKSYKYKNWELVVLDI